MSIVGMVARERARKIRLVVLDVDGVLTDGGLEYTDAGESSKRFHVHDGLGIRLLIDAGIEVAVVSARQGAPLMRRLADLGITRALTGKRDKEYALRDLMSELELERSEVCFIGDDLLDLPALSLAGLAVAVGDAHWSAREAAHLVTEARGGKGAVREVADLILDVQFGLAQAYQRQLDMEQKRVRQSRPPGEPAKFGVIIPARYASSRLPGKPLRDLVGKPMIVRVLENAEQSGAEFVWVATDDQRIFEAVEAVGGTAVMTSDRHTTGTDRLAEVVDARGIPDDTIVVNVQGDEPLLDAKYVHAVAQALENDPSSGIATLATPIRVPGELFDPNVVKVVLRGSGHAQYFSRAPIPWNREAFHEGKPLVMPPDSSFLRHVGLYAYRASTLRRLTKTPPSPTEIAEKLEQLRALWVGINLSVIVVDEPPGIGVDTEEDLARVATLIRERMR
jgi:3-deoxy-manno-octulosonate cytidylyltransferase (CMP-KDO synthetase)